jgi:microcystin-dependent protein
MGTGVISWSQTAATNANADSAVNWAEGMAPSAVNDSARATMASVAKYRDDLNGSITTAGTSTAYTVTSNQGLALTAGYMVAFVPHATNDATVTLNVDTLGAKPLRSAPGVELSAGVIVEGTPYAATYYTTNSGEWILHGFFANPYIVPIGMMAPYVGTTAPNSNFVFPYGQAISRTTYSALFAITSTTFGTGDGSTTFNVPDIRGRAIFGKDDMGGTAASRITTAGSSVDGTAVGASGGAQSVTVAQANLPNVNFTVSISSGQGSHSHSIAMQGSGGAPGLIGLGDGNGASGGTTTGTSTLPALSGTAASGGSGTAIKSLPPAIIMPYVLRVI